ncbi:MAG: molybdopterin-guanine dinucleotide biosynthesis protein B [bacterium]
MTERIPVFGICGYSGAGKTTLIEELVRRLSRQGLRVGVIKHDAHGLDIDREGKDTDRFFKAGADVLIRGPAEAFFRAHRRDDMPLENVLRVLGPHVDLILVEGHKTTPLANKLWLSGPEGDPPPAGVTPVQFILGRNEDRPHLAMDLIEARLPSLWRAAPLYAGILTGGRSSRMGRPKHLIEQNGETWLERAVSAVRGQVEKIVLLGRGEVPALLQDLPVLNDVENACGPLSGMRAAMRWAPLTSWIFVPCDLPLLSGDAVRWLLEQRRPGVWAVLPLLPGASRPEPLLACYDFRSATLLESVNRPSDCAGKEKVVSPLIPAAWVRAWKNVNTPEELAGV